MDLRLLSKSYTLNVEEIFYKHFVFIYVWFNIKIAFIRIRVLGIFGTLLEWNGMIISPWRIAYLNKKFSYIEVYFIQNSIIYYISYC